MPDETPSTDAPEGAQFPPPAPPAPPAPPPTTPPPPPPAQTTDWEADAKKWQDLARKHEERAKANAQAAKDLEQLRQSQMTEQEKAVAEAKALGRREALLEVGGQLVASEMRAAAAGRLDDKAIHAVVANLSPSAFVNDDGTVDTNAVKGFVESIAPAPVETGPPPDPRFPDLGQGQRGAAPASQDEFAQQLAAAVGSKL